MSMKTRSIQFTKVPTVLVKDALLSSVEKVVYAVIRSFGTENKQGSAYPSRRQIAQCVPCAIRTVDRAIRGLVSKGYIRYAKGGRGQSNSYTFPDSMYPHSFCDYPVLGAAMTPQSVTHDPPMETTGTLYQEPSTKNHNPADLSVRLFHGRDPAYIQDDGSVLIMVSGQRKSWSGYGAQDFVFGAARGEDALNLARAIYDRSSRGQGSSYTVQAVPTKRRCSSTTK